MSKTNTPQIIVPAVIGYVMIVEAASFLLVAILHLGIPFPLGLTQPMDPWAASVEIMCGIFLAISAFFVLSHKPQAWRLSLAAHIFSIVGVLIGIIVTSRVGLPADDFNGIYHRTILAVLVISLMLLVSPFARKRRVAQS